MPRPFILVFSIQNNTLDDSVCVTDIWALRNRVRSNLLNDFNKNRTSTGFARAT